MNKEQLAFKRDLFKKKQTFTLPFGRGGVDAWECSDDARLCGAPVVSVLMLAYRHEPYIAQAIKGVVRQNLSFPMELIIGEDCSPDKTLEVALYYQKRYPEIIRILSSDANVGARKNAYRLEMSARGKYIAYCEGDDCWHDADKLRMQVDFLENNPGYGMAFTNADYFDVATGVRKKNAVPFKPDLWRDDNAYLSQLMGATTILPLTVCVRTSLSRQVINECQEVTDSAYAMGDTQRYLEIAMRTRIKYFPASAATHNLLPESASRSQNILKKAAFVESGKRLTLHYLDKYPLPPDQDKEVRRWVALRSLYYAYLCRDRDRAFEEKKVLDNLGVELPWKFRLYWMGSRGWFANILVSVLFRALDGALAVRRHATPLSTHLIP